MATLIAVDACESLMQVTAVEKEFEDLGSYRPVDQAGRIQFNPMPGYTRQCSAGLKIRVSVVQPRSAATTGACAHSAPGHHKKLGIVP